MPKHQMTVKRRQYIVTLLWRIVDNQAPLSFVPMHRDEVMKLHDLNPQEALFLKKLLRVWLDYRLPTD